MLNQMKIKPAPISYQKTSFFACSLMSVPKTIMGGEAKIKLALLAKLQFFFFFLHSKRFKEKENAFLMVSLLQSGLLLGRN